MDCKWTSPTPTTSRAVAVLKNQSVLMFDDWFLKLNCNDIESLDLVLFQ